MLGANKEKALKDGILYSWGTNRQGQLGLGHYDHQNTPQKIEGRLERAFKLGHLSLFSDKSPEERQFLKNRFLSQHVSFNDEINGDNIQDNPLGRQA